MTPPPKLPNKGTLVRVSYDGAMCVGRVEDVLFAESDPDETELFIRFTDGDAAWLHAGDVEAL